MDSSSTPHRKWSRSEVARLLTCSTALTDLDHDAARVVAKAMQASSLKAGAVLMQEGVASTGFLMLVLHGEVVVEQQSVKRANSLILGVMGPGSVLGEMSLMDGEPRSATCTAHSDLDVAVLDRAALADLMETNPAACNKLLAVLLKRVSERLRATNKKLRALTQVNQSLQDHGTVAGQTPKGAATLAPLVAAPSEGMILL